MVELHSCYPFSCSDTRKHLKRGQIEYKGKAKESRGARLLQFLHPFPAGFYSSVCFGWELPNFSSHQEVHHHFIAYLHGEQLRDLRVSASACSPPSHISQLFPEHRLLVFQSAAVAEEMFPRLGCHPSCTAAAPIFLIVSVSKPFQLCAHWSVSGLQSVEPG